MKALLSETIDVFKAEGIRCLVFDKTVDEIRRILNRYEELIPTAWSPDSDDRTRASPIVAMTSSNQDRDVAESYRLGVNGYVTKPVQIAPFMELVLKIGLYWLSANRVP